jgi:flagellar motor protein MotB
MVTLLLTFFVMLLTLADVQDPELFDKGRDSFIESLRYVGLGMLIGRQQKPNLGSTKSIYYIPNSDQASNDRIIDAKAEELYRIFEKLKQSTTTMSSRLTAERVNFSVTNIHFSPGSAELDKSAMTFLTEFCRDLHLGTGGRPGILYVLGLAPDEKTEKDQWILSAKRAEAVAHFMRKNLEPVEAGLQQGLSESLLNWSVHSWGAGLGGEWAGPDSFISEHSQILIAILR